MIQEEDIRAKTIVVQPTVTGAKEMVIEAIPMVTENHVMATETIPMVTGNIPMATGVILMSIGALATNEEEITEIPVTRGTGILTEEVILVVMNDQAPETAMREEALAVTNGRRIPETVMVTTEGHAGLLIKAVPVLKTPDQDLKNPTTETEDPSFNHSEADHPEEGLSRKTISLDLNNRHNGNPFTKLRTCQLMCRYV